MDGLADEAEDVFGIVLADDTSENKGKSKGGTEVGGVASQVIAQQRGANLGHPAGYQD